MNCDFSFLDSCCCVRPELTPDWAFVSASFALPMLFINFISWSSFSAVFVQCNHEFNIESARIFMPRFAPAISVAPCDWSADEPDVKRSAVTSASAKFCLRRSGSCYLDASPPPVVFPRAKPVTRRFTDRIVASFLQFDCVEKRLLGFVMTLLASFLRFSGVYSLARLVFAIIAILVATKHSPRR